VLVAALGPRPGERWLDVGTGGGGVALRAARAGSEVTGVDIAARAVEEAQRAAAEEGVRARFEVADAERLPYSDGHFDVVSSAFGVIFARSHERAAAELARVCAPGGRLGLTLMPPGTRAADLWTLVRRHGVDEGRHPASWAEPGRPLELLGEWFEMEVSAHETPAEGEPEPDEEAWVSMFESFGPREQLAAELDESRLASVRSEFAALRARHAGRARRYVLVIGRRR
jgi:SAM-dependent methyltransferase